MVATKVRTSDDCSDLQIQVINEAVGFVSQGQQHL
jgi:hypothetical protein